LDKYYQRFKIDDHLNRYQKALKNLSLAGKIDWSEIIIRDRLTLNLSGPERFEEAVTYLEQHRLYEDALRIWKDTENYEVRRLSAIVPDHAA